MAHVQLIKQSRREGDERVMQPKQATEADPTNDEEQAIRSLVDSWLKASKDGDLTTMLSLLSDDVLFMVPGKEPFGKEAFARNYENIKGKKMKTDSDIQEIRIIGDWAWMRNFLRVTFISSSGESTVLSGHVLSVLRKNPAGKWVIARDANLLMPENASDR